MRKEELGLVKEELGLVRERGCRGERKSGLFYKMIY
jgi:hypothetical protein